MAIKPGRRITLALDHAWYQTIAKRKFLKDLSPTDHPTDLISATVDDLESPQGIWVKPDERFSDYSRASLFIPWSVIVAAILLGPDDENTESPYKDTEISLSLKNISAMSDASEHLFMLDNDQANRMADELAIEQAVSSGMFTEEEARSLMSGPSLAELVKHRGLPCNREGDQMNTPEANQFIYLRRSASHREFIEFWAAGYDEDDSKLYTPNINGPHTADTLRELFRWKIEKRWFTTHLKGTVEPQFLLQIDKAKRLPPKISAEDFLGKFEKGGAIYRIFWLHCWHPDRFPIYDQHAHRAMVFINEGKLEELDEKYTTESKQIQSYLNSYLPFIKPFLSVDLPFDSVKDGVPGRKADRALWTFGKFLLSHKWLLPDG